MSRTPFFDDTQRAMLMTFVRDGRLTAPMLQVAKELGTSETTVRGEIQRNSIAPFQKRRFDWTKERLDLLKEHTDDTGRLTASATRVAGSLGCSRETLISGLILLKGKTPKPFVHTPEVKATLINLLDSQGRLKVTLYEAAAELACSLNDIRRALKKYRIPTKT